jgi:hypothetical protein
LIEKYCAHVGGCKTIQRLAPTAGIRVPVDAGAIDIVVQLFQAKGIGCNDEWRPPDLVLRGFRQFHAPVLIGVTFDREHAAIASD